MNFWVNLTDRDKFRDQLQNVGRIEDFETSFRKKSGEVYTCLVSGEIIRIQDEQFVLFGHT